jgi:hypothetical protein
MPSPSRVADRYLAASADDLDLVRVDVQRAGFGAGPMMRNLSRGRPHDPREVVGAEVTLSGTPEALLSRGAHTRALVEARRAGVYASAARRRNDPHLDTQGRMVVTFTVD